MDAIVGIHLRPEQEAKKGQATPALCHGSSGRIEATIEGVAAHGGRPHLGVNAIDAAAAVVNAINAIHMNPVVPYSIKVTKLLAGGAATNLIPDQAEMAIDVRAQQNGLMQELLKKAEAAIGNAAASVGAKAVTRIKTGPPAAEYTEEMVELAREAIVAVLGKAGLLPPIITPGAEDFHFYVKRKPTIKAAYIGLGCDLTPGLHHPQMKFDVGSLINGVNILQHIVNRMLNAEPGSRARRDQTSVSLTSAATSPAEPRRIGDGHGPQQDPDAAQGQRELQPLEVGDPGHGDDRHQHAGGGNDDVDEPVAIEVGGHRRLPVKPDDVGDGAS